MKKKNKNKKQKKKQMKWAKGVLCVCVGGGEAGGQPTAPGARQLVSSGQNFTSF